MSNPLKTIEIIKNHKGNVLFSTIIEIIKNIGSANIANTDDPNNIK